MEKVKIRTNPMSINEIREQELRMYRFLEGKQRHFECVNPYLRQISGHTAMCLRKF